MNATLTTYVPFELAQAIENARLELGLNLSQAISRALEIVYGAGEKAGTVVDDD